VWQHNTAPGMVPARRLIAFVGCCCYYVSYLSSSAVFVRKRVNTSESKFDAVQALEPPSFHQGSNNVSACLYLTRAGRLPVAFAVAQHK
jgi:hypothetical protein